MTVDSRRPALSSAMWAFFGISLITALVVIGLQQSFEAALVRVLAAVVVTGGGTILAINLSKVRFAPLMGRLPRMADLLLAVAMGALLWLPTTWLVRTTNYLLLVSLGEWVPPLPLAPEGALPLAVVFQLGLLVPFCHGVLFWGFMHSAAQPLGRRNAALLTGLLFGLFGLVNTEFGLSIVPAWAVLGTMAAFAVSFTSSGWIGVAVLAGYSFVRPILEKTLLEAQIFSYLGVLADDLFATRWLLVAVLTGFLAFTLLQFIRIRGVNADPEWRPAPARPIWLGAFVLALALYGLIGYNELRVRAASPLDLRPPPDSNSTNLPGTP